MNTKYILLLACWLWFIGITPLLGQNINGTWYLNGFHNEVTADNFIPTISSITGTVTINTGSGTISFSTNLGSWTESDGFVQNGDTYLMEYPSNEDPNHYPGFIIAIRIIDENSLVISTCEEWGNDTDLYVNRVEGLVGMLTKHPISVSTPVEWEGNYNYKGLVLSENENDGNIEGIRLQKESGISGLEKISGIESYTLNYDGSLIATSLTEDNNILTWSENNNSNYVFSETQLGLDENDNPIWIKHRNVQSRDQVRSIRLNDGNFAVFHIYNQRAITESNSNDESLNGISFIGGFEYRATMLVTKSIGELDIVTGSDAQISRNGETIIPESGYKVYEGDVISTGTGTGVTIKFWDGTIMTVRPNSEVLIQEYTPSPGQGGISGFINLLKGKLRMEILNDSEPGEPKLIIQTRKTTGGVRGTIFEVEHLENDGVATSIWTVESGLVDVTDNLTDYVNPLSAGEELTLHSVIVDIEPMDSIVQQGDSAELNVSVSAPSPTYQWYRGSEYDMSQPVDAATDPTLVIAAVTEPDYYWVFVTSGPYQGKSRLAYVALEPTEAVSYADATASAGLEGADALPTATPFNDGVPNLLKFAFNMNLAGPDSSSLTPGGSSGLPVGGLIEEEGQTYWRVEYVRRKDSGLSYTPQKSSTLAEDSFTTMTGEETVTEIPGEPEWERVTINEPCDPATETRCFSRVRVELP